jgi:ADP-ribose pyrophosphatase YjhB (NUDIX family)
MDFEAEVEHLAGLIGEPLRLSELLPPDHSYLAGLDDRRLLAMTKPFYPARVFRLPTGGVDGDEAILEALNREVAEETSLEVEVARFLAHVQYRIPGRERPADRPYFETFAFLVNELSGELRCSDPDEAMEFKEIDASDIPRLARALEELEDTESEEIGDTWASWGRFRAIAQ